MLLDHNKNPKNFKALDNPTHIAHGVNPLCGDDYYIFLDVKNDTILDIGFTGTGCAISKSVSSMMTEVIKGKTIDDAMTIKSHFIDMLTKEITNSSARHILGNLKIFENVKDFPIRVKCATLIWRALEAAILNNRENISTE